MTEREKEYVCDQLCKYPYIFDDIDLERTCETCMLNKSRTQLRKEYMQQYYKTKIKPARSKRILDEAVDGAGKDGNVKDGEAE